MDQAKCELLLRTNQPFRELVAEQIVSRPQIVEALISLFRARRISDRQARIAELQAEIDAIMNEGAEG